MPVSFRVISIGTLASHPLWHEPPDVRTGHATTTLISAEDARILVDPGLPGPVVEARLAERSGLRVADITHVFLTSLTGDHCRGLGHFDGATWFTQERERDAALARMQEHAESAASIDDAALEQAIATQRDLIARCRPAPDALAAGVDLFPLPGVTPGSCGLLLSQPMSTVLVCGDAVATVEHLAEGKVLPTCADIEQATESFREAVEIADLLVLGRDNVTTNPLRRI